MQRAAPKIIGAVRCGRLSAGFMRLLLKAAARPWILEEDGRGNDSGDSPRTL